MSSEELRLNNLFDVSGKVVVVTGGTRGIGFMIASGFYANGATVYVNSRKQKDCDYANSEFEKLKSNHSGKYVTVVAELGDEKGCIKYAEEIKKREQRVDVLVNNAGTSWAAPLEQYPDSAWDKLMALNVKAAFHMTKFLLPLLRNAKNGASVINIGSISGESVSKFEYYAYSASKAALHHLTRHLANRLAVDKIRVNCLACGPFLTQLTRAAFEKSGENIEQSVPLQRTGIATDVAGTCLYLGSTAGAWTTGTILPLDGGHLIKAKL